MAVVTQSDHQWVNLIVADNSEVMKEELKRQPSMIERLYGELCCVSLYSIPVIIIYCEVCCYITGGFKINFKLT